MDLEVLEISDFRRMIGSDRLKSREQVVLEKSHIFRISISLHLATLINIWHIWEGISSKVSMEEINLRFFHRDFWFVISRTVWKPCVSTPIPRGAKSWICGQLGGGAIWTKKCWFFIVNIGVWARDLLFRVGKTRASVTKYAFSWSRWMTTVPAHLSRPLTNTVRTPHRKLCLGN